ncbi:MAG: hypothetical protein ACRDZ9_04695 [Acidimicrobiales bacterium]
MTASTGERADALPSCPSCGAPAQPASDDPGDDDERFVCANPHCPDRGEVVG